MDMLKLAEEFAEVMWPYKENLRIKEISLYGSLARFLAGATEAEPNDADILALHTGNQIIQRYQEELQGRKDISDTLKCEMLCKELLKAGYLIPQLNEIIIQGIKAGKLNLSFLDIRFFTDSVYQDRMGGLSRDPMFYEHIFDDALLYNPKTGKFDIPNTNYVLSMPRELEEKVATI